VLLASLPSPSSGSISLGPLELRAYGVMIALGVLAAVWLLGRRLAAKGIGTAEDAQYIALWGVPAGIVGARLYHVITDWQRFEDSPLDALKVWQGGLGIWGGIALGVAAGLWAARRRGVPLLPGLDAVAPALALAQAIGRWGNWWNQELFGEPTDLPWALEIDPEHRPEGYEQYATFHPVFLYESLWNFLLCGALLLIDKRWRVRPGRLFAMYVAGYTFMRFWLEGLRIDPANSIAGLRVNEWVSLVIFLASVGFLVVDAVRHRDDPVLMAAPDEPAEPLTPDAVAPDADEPAVEPEADEPSDAADLVEPVDATGQRRDDAE